MAVTVTVPIIVVNLKPFTNEIRIVSGCGDSAGAGLDTPPHSVRACAMRSERRENFREDGDGSVSSLK